MFVVDHAVIEAGGLDDPGDAARCELLEAGAKRGPPLAHRPPYAVLFHGYEAPIARQRIPHWPCDTSPMTRQPLPCGRLDSGHPPYQKCEHQRHPCSPPITGVTSSS